MHPQDFLSVFHGFILFLLYGSCSGQRRGSAQPVDFDCPEEFGYYPHPSDCTQYYVCVFGGAVLESCTGGLMYSHELQTCDWPRNVGCGGDTDTVSTVRVTDPRTRHPPPHINRTPTQRDEGRQSYQISQEEPQQQKRVTYEDEIGPAEEVENDRQQRVYRGQPSTVGQVARDRDGLQYNSIPLDKSRLQDKYSRVEEDAPVVAVTPRYNSSARVQPTPYDQYYQFYEQEPEIYRAQQFSEQRPSSTAKSPIQQYRGQSVYEKQQQQQQQQEQQVYNGDVYSQQAPAISNDYNDETDEQQFQQLASPKQPNRQRGGSSYNGVVASGETSPTKTSSRGTRPTLKPSTAIVSKASEFVDVYKYPPRRPENLYATPTPDKTAAKCRKDVCVLPDCSCGGKDIPGGYSAEEIPQLVLLTFDDSVNDLNKGLYADLFERGRVNPNGCPISATFYVSHEWTDYSQVQNLYANGHEIASHSVSHSFGEQFSHKKWLREIAGQREILAAYGGVRLEDVRGMRAPFLAVGGNKMFKMLHDANFTYDSSMPIYENKPPSWPYTLDYKLFHDCMIPPCPTKSYPGLWEVPMVMWQDLNGGRCSMGDACSNPPTADGVYKMLIKNFERHFTTNRAPFGLFYHAAWFTHEHHKEGFIAFLDTIVNMPEVWLVNNWQAIQWVRDPQPLSTVQNFPAFQCNQEKAKKCNNPKVCNLWHKSGVRYMRTCQPCPDVYPWTGKTGVRNSRVDNEIQDD